MKTIKLLLIEDDNTLAYVVKNIMENLIGGYEVNLAFNGKEGLEHFQSFAPDVIVSDIEMPVMNGLEMVKKIREIDVELPIIFATSRNTSKDVTIGYDVGVDNYIKKPISPDELDAHLKALINIKNIGKSQLKNDNQRIGKYTFKLKDFALIYNNSERIKLTARESQILQLLLENKGKVVKREEILDKFWTKVYALYASRSLNVFITKLRRYLSKDDSISIKNVKLEGLILDFD